MHHILWGTQTRSPCKAPQSRPQAPRETPRRGRPRSSPQQATTRGPRRVHKLDLPAKTLIQPPPLTSARTGRITPKNSAGRRSDALGLSVREQVVSSWRRSGFVGTRAGRLFVRTSFYASIAASPLPYASARVRRGEAPLPDAVWSQVFGTHLGLMLSIPKTKTPDFRGF